MKFEFSVDRGGTFTDIYCVIYDQSGAVVGIDRDKLLSEDYHYDDPISEGIRRIIERNTGEKLPAKIPSNLIVAVRIGTTIGTNALLEAKGSRTAILMTKGFKDLLTIGNQTRPKIFELDIKKFKLLFEEVVEVDERVEVVSSIERAQNPDLRDTRYTVVKPINETEVAVQLAELKQRGIESVAISLMHSYEYQEHEKTLRRLALEAGFESVFLSHESSNKIGYLSRTSTCLIDAYLFPVIKKYLQRITSKFEDDGRDIPLYIMQSDGSITPIVEFTGSKSILSGPAGGVTGFSKTTIIEGKLSEKVIGFDMGGTSTDVSTFEGAFEMSYESEIAGTFISSPHLDINTVAAGGGSCVFFENGMLKVGPESAGSNPGPVCYGKDGKLAITDLNLLLGRIHPEYFPHIFGKNQDMPLDAALSRHRFEQLIASIKQKEDRFRNSSLEDIAFGFIQVANEVMCRPIRALTESRGKDPKNFDLAVFGGAGAQHACSVASILGIKRVFIHKYSSILSGYGIFLADIVREASLFYNKPLASLEKDRLLQDIHHLMQQSEAKLAENERQQFRVEYETSFVLRYSGSESVITINRDDCLSKGFEFEDLLKEFRDVHQSMYGFLMERRDILLLNVYLKLRLARKDIDRIQAYVHAKAASTGCEPVEHKEIPFFNLKTRTVTVHRTPIYLESKLQPGSTIAGPAIVIMNGSSIVVEPHWLCSYNDRQDFELTRQLLDQQASDSTSNERDPVMLSIFGQRFMSIAEQMGRRLQRTALSTNIKERLDFSCAVFGPDGSLVANAPHLPVHLGSMESTVTYQIRTLGDSLTDGDVVMSNHPKAGGSHLPDITVITPCFFGGKPIFYVASRGHHSDIGGITPGSMPSFAESIFQEGVSFKSFQLVKNGLFREAELEEALRNPPDGIIGSRNVEENIADLKAQVASNKRGVELLLKLVEEYSLQVVHSYMNFIQDAAELSVRNMLTEISLKNHMGEVDTVVQDDYMDDGSLISLQLTIDRRNQTAVFDFSKSGLEVLGNFNTPNSVVRSAIIYCLRCLVSSDIPLNAGCLRPVQILTSEGSILNPSENAAIVGGNVTTSQRITDVILKAFKAAADSQGCMNNFTFGDSTFGYYETIAGGSGAGPHWSGVDAVQCHMTNTRITDPEILESRFPVVLLQFAIRPASGGTGKHCGGNGAVRSFKFKTQLQVSILSERRVFAPEGICGGSNGARGTNELTFAGGRRVNLGGKCSLTVDKGAVITISTPGGGGFGVPDGSAVAQASQQQSHATVDAGSLSLFNKLQEQA